MSKILALFLTLLMISTLPLGTQARISNPEDKEEPKYETRVYIRPQCLISEERDLSKTEPDRKLLNARFVLPVIGAVLMPFIIEGALGRLSGALKKAGEEKTLKDFGRLPTYLYSLQKQGEKNALTINPDFGCVILVRGLFSLPDEDKRHPLVFKPEGIFRNANTEDRERRRKRLEDNGIPVKEIAAIFEAAPRLADDRTALLYESRFFEMVSFQDSKKGERQLAIGIGIIGAGANEDEPLLSLVLLNLGEVKRETLKFENDLKTGKGRRSSWVGGLAISESSLKAMEAPDFPTPTTTQPVGIMPISIEGSFSETDDGNKLLQFIAEVLDASKGDLSKSLSSEILKDRGKLASDAADAREQLVQEEQAAYAEYLKAKAARLPENPTQNDIDARDFEIRRTRRIWCVKNKALQKLGLGGPRPDSTMCSEVD